MDLPSRSAGYNSRLTLELAKERLVRGEPFHLATCLDGSLVDQFPEQRDRHLSLPRSEQQELLRSALERRDISAATAVAITSLRRDLFVTPEQKPRAFLDEYHQANGGSGLTPPRLIGTMLDRLDLQPGHRVLELGVGSCFHALAAQALCPVAALVGIDPDSEVLEQSRCRLEEQGLAGALTLLIDDDPLAALPYGPFDRIYATFAFQKPLAGLRPLLVEGGLAQVPRLLTAPEFRDDELLQPLRLQHGTYENFLEKWQSNLCLTTVQKTAGNLVVIDKHYGVSFVPQREMTANHGG